MSSISTSRGDKSNSVRRRTSDSNSLRLLSRARVLVVDANATLERPPTASRVIVEMRTRITVSARGKTPLCQIPPSGV